MKYRFINCVRRRAHFILRLIIARLRILSINLLQLLLLKYIIATSS